MPRSFQPELPNPVPGESQSAWGFPVTLQTWLGSYARVQEVRMALHEGGRSGPEVSCHFSAPEHPTNPDLVPSHAWCLIPKRHLEAHRQYTVVAEIADPVEEHVWSFTTGDR